MNTNRKKLETMRGTRQQILIGLVLATIAVAVIEANSEYDEECGWSLMGTVVSHYGSGDRQKLRIGRGRCRIDVDLRGDIDFTPDNRGVAQLGPEASISIRERLGRERRRLDAELGEGGKPEYTWYVGSLPKPFGDEARDWLAEILPRIYRSSGLDADGRIEQLRAAGGLDAVLQEMDEIEGTSVRAVYLKELLAQTADEGELVRVLDYGRRQISSDHSLARALGTLDPARLTSEPVREAWVLALRSIDSDWELRRLLSSAVSKGNLSIEVVDSILEAGRTVGSDHEQAELLAAVARNTPDVALPPSYFRALESIGSDYEHKRTVLVALEREGLAEGEADRLLATARQISSDSELAEITTTFARNVPREWSLPESFFEIHARIDADSISRRVLETVVEHRNLDPETAVELFGAARSLSSDFELSAWLVRFLEVYPSSAKLPEGELDQLVRSVGSDFERGKVEEVLAAWRSRAPSPAEQPAPEAEPALKTEPAPEALPVEEQ